MTVMHTEAERLAMIREALERLTAAATGLFEDWQQARSFLPSGCRKLMEDLTFEQASWLGRFEREAGEGTSFSALESFEGFAANVRRLVSEHAASPLALVGEVFESDDEERLFFRRWKNFLDAGIGTIARSFVIDDIIFAGQIAASMRLVGLLRRITAEWAHLSPEHRHQLGIDFRENAQALSDAYGTASSADFILMKDRFADRLKGEFEGFLEAADHPVDETDRDAVIFRAASERFSKGVIATVKSVVTQCERGGPEAVRAFGLTLDAGRMFLELPGGDETAEYCRRTLLPRLERLLESVRPHPGSNNETPARTRGPADVRASAFPCFRSQPAMGERPMRTVEIQKGSVAMAASVWAVVTLATDGASPFIEAVIT